MYQAIPDLSLLAMREAAEKGWPLHKAEREVIGFDYHAVGGELLRQWSLPESLWETTMFHNEPDKADRYRRETALVHLGVLLTRAAKGEGLFNEGLLIVEPSVWTVTGLSSEFCVALDDEIAGEASEVTGLIFPGECPVSC
jgi:hypothetical protein